MTPEEMRKFLEREGHSKEFIEGATTEQLQRAVAYIQTGRAQRERLRELLSKPKVPRKSLGVGVYNGVFYFGTAVSYRGRTFSAIVTSDKRLLVGYNENNEIKNDFGLDYQTEYDEDILIYPWQNSMIELYLQDGYALWSVQELFERIRELNKKYVYHVDERIHDYVACDIISNYLYPIFDTKGRTYFNAPKGSGKSRQTKVYELLSFNSILSSRITAAGLFRTTESVGCTHLIDNFDSLPEDTKKELLNLIQTGYQNNAKVILIGDRSRRAEKYAVFCPMVINNIVGLDEITLDRCFTIKMLKNREFQRSKPRAKDQIWEDVRNQLRFNALDRWKEFEACYETMNVPEISGRELEVTEGVLCAAKVVGQEIYNKVLSLIKDTFEEKKKNKDLSSDKAWLLYSLVLTKLGDLKEDWYRITDLSDVLTPQFYGITSEHKLWFNSKLKTSKAIAKLINLNPLIMDEDKRAGHANFPEVRFVKDKILRWLEANDYPTSPNLIEPTPTSPNLTEPHQKEWLGMVSIGEVDEHEPVVEAEYDAK
jgi:hypothetical protein